MGTRSFLLAASVLTSLAACEANLEPDYESYKTANPYDYGPYRPQSTPRSGASDMAPVVTTEPAIASPAPTAAPVPSPAPAAGTSTFNMVYETSRSGGTARINGERVEVKRVGKATSGEVTYMVLYMGKNGATTAIPEAQQAGVAASLVRGMTQCQVSGPATSSGGDVLSMIGGVPEARYTVRAVCS